MNILDYKKIFFWFSGLLVVFSVVLVILYGLNLGIDFTGGSVLEIKTNIAEQQVKDSLKSINLEGSVRSSGEDNFIIRTKTIDETKKFTY